MVVTLLFALFGFVLEGLYYSWSRNSRRDTDAGTSGRVDCFGV